MDEILRILLEPVCGWIGASVLGIFGRKDIGVLDEAAVQAGRNVLIVPTLLAVAAFFFLWGSM